jgi:organic hydroperoxide reductase OsmC/OhrA
MSIVKAFRYPVSVGWRGGRMARASAVGKTDLDLATPPEFRGGVAGVWSPEELLVASTASCLALTVAAIADWEQVSLSTLQVDGIGHVEKRRDGRYAFVAIELTVEIETDDESLEAARAVVRQAEERCIVTLALDVPVHVRLVLPSATGVGLSE